MDDTIPQDDISRKQCLTCHQWLPTTTEYFNAHKHGRFGLNEHCKTCRNAARRKVPLFEPVPKGYKRCSKCREVKPATPEFFRRNGKELCSACRECTHKRPPKEVRPGQKQCFACKEWFPATTEYFYRDRSMGDGFLSWCKTCSREKDRLRRERVKEIPPVLLICTQCGKEKRTADEFPKRPTNPNGISTECKECTNLRHRQFLQEPGQKAKQNLLNRRNYELNKVAWRRTRREWKRNHPEWVIAYAHKRRALKRSAPGAYTPEQILKLLKRQHYSCYYAACGHAKFEKRNGKYVYHVDHTVPLSRTEAGPRNDIDALVLACPACNLSKLNKLPHEWFEGGRLL